MGYLIVTITKVMDHQNTFLAKSDNLFEKYPYLGHAS